MPGYAFDIPGSWVRATYKHLLGEPLVIDTQAGSFPLDSIVRIKNLNDDGSIAMRIGVYRVLKWESPNGHTLEYAVDRHPEDVVVMPDWLDKHYPGWKTRLATAESLGLDSPETAAYVCSIDTPVSPNTLPNVSFD